MLRQDAVATVCGRRYGGQAARHLAAVLVVAQRGLADAVPAGHAGASVLECWNIITRHLRHPACTAVNITGAPGATYGTHAIVLSLAGSAVQSPKTTPSPFQIVSDLWASRTLRRDKPKTPLVSDEGRRGPTLTQEYREVGDHNN